MKFNVDDVVKCTWPCGDLVNGAPYTVEKATGDNIELLGLGGLYSVDRFVLIKTPFKTGDIVKCVCNGKGTLSLNIGQHYTVKSVRDRGHMIGIVEDVRDPGMEYMSQRFELVTAAPITGRPNATSKFKLFGTQVKCVKVDADNRLHLGRVYEITSITGIAIQLFGMSEWWFHETLFELVSPAQAGPDQAKSAPPRPAPQFVKGNKVLCVASRSASLRCGCEYTVRDVTDGYLVLEEFHVGDNIPSSYWEKDQFVPQLPGPDWSKLPPLSADVKQEIHDAVLANGFTIKEYSENLVTLAFLENTSSHNEEARKASVSPVGAPA